MPKTFLQPNVKSDLRIPCNFWRYDPTKTPHFRVFRAFVKVWRQMTSQPLQIRERAIHHWKERKK